MSRSVRGCLESGFWWSFCRSAKPSEHESAHSQIDEVFFRGGQELVVFAEPPIVAQPGKGALDHPASFEHGESRHGRRLDAFGIPAPATRFLDNFHAPAQVLSDPSHQPATVARVGPQVLELGKACCRRGEQRAGSVAVGHVRRMNLRAKHQPRAIYEQVALASADLLATVVAVHTAARSGLCALAVNDGSGRLRRSACPSPAQAAQPSVQAQPHACHAPLAKVVIDGLPRWEVAGQQVPSAPRAHEIKNGVADQAPRVLARPATVLGRWQKARQFFPLAITQIGGETRTFILQTATKTHFPDTL